MLFDRWKYYFLLFLSGLWLPGMLSAQGTSFFRVPMKKPPIEKEEALPPRPTPVRVAAKPKPTPPPPPARPRPPSRRRSAARAPAPPSARAGAAEVFGVSKVFEVTTTTTLKTPCPPGRTSGRGSIARRRARSPRP